MLCQQNPHSIKSTTTLRANIRRTSVPTNVLYQFFMFPVSRATQALYTFETAQKQIKFRDELFAANAAAAAGGNVCVCVCVHPQYLSSPAAQFKTLLSR